MRRLLAEISSNPIALDLLSLDKRERTLERLVGMNSKSALSCQVRDCSYHECRCVRPLLLRDISLASFGPTVAK